jgi:hypothetical protein
MQEELAVRMKEKSQPYIRPLYGVFRLLAMMEIRAFLSSSSLRSQRTLTPAGLQKRKASLSCHHIEFTLRNSLLTLFPIGWLLPGWAF